MSKDYESTVMRMAGNIIGSVMTAGFLEDDAVELSVRVARKIVDEVKRTTPNPMDRS